MTIRVRRSLQEIYADYLSGKDRATLQTLIRAFKGIQEKRPSDENSFYVLAGWHGEPFRGPGKESGANSWWWGGYCNHGNVLFPTWHRAYLKRLEEALQSVEGCEDVVMPFWDECFSMGQSAGQSPTVIPEILTTPKFQFDGENEPIENPLYSYRLAKDTSFTQSAPWDLDAAKNNTRFSKPKGYQTCRFPFSGLVGNEEARNSSMLWNAQFIGSDQHTKILNGNVSNWLEGQVELNSHPNSDSKPPKIPDTFSTYAKYRLCLDAPNYTVFSNTTSATQWVKESSTPNDRNGVVSIEGPHNAIHLAIGGFYQEGIYNANVSDYQQAGGDMGDNETASFDPIFFFHHCFIDYVFWCYQKRHNLTQRGSLSVIFDYDGTVTDANGSPVGLPPGSVLDMNTRLMPFRPAHPDNYFTSHEVTNIEELGYTYGPGSLDSYVGSPRSTLSYDPWADTKIATWKSVRGINRARIEGSFVIRTYAVSPNGLTKIEIGREPVLSRLNVRGCKNCQTHLEANSLMPLYQPIVDYLLANNGGGDLDDRDIEDIKFEVRIQTHDGTLDSLPTHPGLSSKEDKRALTYRQRPVVVDLDEPATISAMRQRQAAENFRTQLKHMKVHPSTVQHTSSSVVSTDLDGPPPLARL